jgi:hypothetical protein
MAELMNKNRRPERDQHGDNQINGSQYRHFIFPPQQRDSMIISAKIGPAIIAFSTRK